MLILPPGVERPKDPPLWRVVLLRARRLLAR